MKKKFREIEISGNKFAYKVEFSRQKLVVKVWKDKKLLGIIPTNFWILTREKIINLISSQNYV